MHRRNFVSGLLTAWLCKVGKTSASGFKSSEPPFFRLQRIIRSRQVDRLEVLWMSPTAESRAEITHGELERLYVRRLVLTEVRSVIPGLMDALQKTVFKRIPLNAQNDFRWSLKIFERPSMKAVCVIYLDGSGQFARIDDELYSATPPLANWLSNAIEKLPGEHGKGK